MTILATHYRIILFTVLAASSCFGDAVAQTSEARTEPIEADDVQMSIKPMICVAARGDRFCSSVFEVDWISSQDGDFCLKSHAESEQADDQPAPLQCWTQSAHGHHADQRQLTEHRHYWLIDASSREPLSTQTVRIALLKPHRKYPRRRTRLPWSVIQQ